MREAEKVAAPGSNNAVEANETTPLRTGTTTTSSSGESTESKERFRKWAIIICVASALLNAILSLTGFVIAALRNSPATYAFAADCLLDLVSSLIVIWRYYGSTFTVYSENRERVACVGLGIFFIVASVGIIIEGIVNLVLREYPHWSLPLLIMSGVGLLCCIFMAVGKFFISRWLKSKSLFLDGLNSLLSGVFALVIIISDVVHHFNPMIWYLDPILSICVSVVTICFGVRIIFEHAGGGELQPCFC